MARVIIDYGTYTYSVEEDFMNEEQKALYESQKQKSQTDNTDDSANQTKPKPNPK
jgi:hypothetical protein